MTFDKDTETEEQILEDIQQWAKGNASPPTATNQNESSDISDDDVQKWAANRTAYTKNVIKR